MTVVMNNRTSLLTRMSVANENKIHILVTKKCFKTADKSFKLSPLVCYLYTEQQT